MSGERAQRTLSGTREVSGTGLHTGAPVRVKLEPAGEDSGIRFFRDGRPIALRATGGAAGESLRCTMIGEGPERVQTVEHLLSALAGMWIDNVDIHVEGPELPLGDGSALPFVEAIKAAGIRALSAPSRMRRLDAPVFCAEPRKAICAYPGEGLRISYVLDHAHPALAEKFFDIGLTPESYEREIAPARTFCTEEEADALRQAGYGKGAGTANTLVMRRDGTPVDNRLRFADECARHKVLDLIGDLALLGGPLSAHVVAVRSGHALNARLVDTLKHERGLI